MYTSSSFRDSLNLEPDLQLWLMEGNHTLSFPGRVAHQRLYLGYFSGILLWLMQPKKGKRRTDKNTRTISRAHAN
jgi:hypothetical protein